MTDKYLEALRRFAEAGDLQMARSVVGSMEQRGVEVGAPHLELLLTANLTGRDPAGARAIVARMRDAGIEVDGGVRHDLAIAAARAGRLADAVGELDALHEEGVKPTSAQLPELLSIHVRAKRFSAARAVLRRLAGEGRGARPADYEALIADLHERKAINDTEAQVEQMLRVGAPPTAAQGRGLVTMVAEAGHPGRASALLDTLWTGDVEVDVQVLSDILDAHARAGDAEAVAATVERMAEVGAEPNSFHRNAMLGARLAAEDADGAWAMVDDMLESGRIPTGDNLDLLFDVTLATGNLTRASGVIDWALILGTPVAPHRLAAAVDGHLQAGELTTARWLFDTAAAAGVPRDRKAARGIVEETIRAGDVDGARSLLSELLATDTLTHGQHWGSLLRALLGARRLDDVVAVIDELTNAGTSPAAADLIRTVHVLLDADRGADALRLTTGSLEAGADVDATNYGELLWLFAKTQDVTAVDAVRDHMVANGVEVEHRHAKAVAHARGEELPDPEPEPRPEPDEAPVTEQVAATDGDELADWERQLQGAIGSRGHDDGSPPEAASAAPDGDGPAVDPSPVAATESGVTVVPEIEEAPTVTGALPATGDQVDAPPGPAAVEEAVAADAVAADAAATVPDEQAAAVTTTDDVAEEPVDPVAPTAGAVPEPVVDDVEALAEEPDVPAPAVAEEVAPDVAPAPADGEPADLAMTPTDELPMTASDEANDDALVAAVEGVAAVPLVTEQSGAAPTGPLGTPDEVTDAALAAQAAPLDAAADDGSPPAADDVDDTLRDSES